MATNAQIAANRANAKLSTGPKSAAGKQASSRNRLDHGFRSAAVLLPGDDPAAYDALLADLTENFGPVDLTEPRYVREMADVEWRLRRVRDWEQRLLAAAIDNLLAGNPGLDLLEAQFQAFEKIHSTSALAACIRYGTQYQRQYDRAYRGWTSYRLNLRRHQQREAKIALSNIVTQPLPARGERSKSSESIKLPFEPNAAAFLKDPFESMARLKPLRPQTKRENPAPDP